MSLPSSSPFHPSPCPIGKCIPPRDSTAETQFCIGTITLVAHLWLMTTQDTHTDRQRDRQTYIHTDRQTDIHTDRQAERTQQWQQQQQHTHRSPTRNLSQCRTPIAHSISSVAGLLFSLLPLVPCIHLRPCVHPWSHINKAMSRGKGQGRQ